MALIIDSSVFIAHERLGEVANALTLTASDEPVAMAAITVSELLVGVHRADSTERRLKREAFVEAVLQQIPIVPFDTRVARVHAVLWAQLTATGQMIGAHDLLIAATAVAYDYTVLTINVRDFQRVPGLKLAASDL